MTGKISKQKNCQNHKKIFDTAFEDLLGSCICIKDNFDPYVLYSVIANSDAKCVALSVSKLTETKTC